MATLIPEIGTSAFEFTCELRLAERLEQKLDNDYLTQAHREGFARGDMAMLRADTKTRDLCDRTLAQRKLPVENRLGSGDFDPTSNKIKMMTMRVSKGVEFPVVALQRAGHMSAAWEDEREAARVFYFATTRAIQRFLIGANAP